MTISPGDHELPRFLEGQDGLVRRMGSEVGRANDWEEKIQRQILAGDLSFFGGTKQVIVINDNALAGEAERALGEVHRVVAGDLVVVRFGEGESEVIEEGVKTISLGADRGNRWKLGRSEIRGASGDTPRVVMIDAGDKRLEDYGFH